MRRARLTTAIPWEQLAQAAKAASAHAYRPYSGFPVGAAVLADDGTLASGCNVENASFGLTTCAERNAVCRAIAEGARRIVALVVYTPTAEPVTPCGACRQVLAEFGRDIAIRCVCDGPGSAQYTLAELLPGAFTLAPPKSGSEM
jgi:cytidine deaminase